MGLVLTLASPGNRGPRQHINVYRRGFKSAAA
jgi:hypothetical protein